MGIYLELQPWNNKVGDPLWGTKEGDESSDDSRHPQDVTTEVLGVITCVNFPKRGR